MKEKKRKKEFYHKYEEIDDVFFHIEYSDMTCTCYYFDKTTKFRKSKFNILKIVYSEHPTFILTFNRKDVITRHSFSLKSSELEDVNSFNQFIQFIEWIKYRLNYIPVESFLNNDMFMSYYYLLEKVEDYRLNNNEKPPIHDNVVDLIKKYGSIIEAKTVLSTLPNMKINVYNYNYYNASGTRKRLKKYLFNEST